MLKIIYLGQICGLCVCVGVIVYKAHSFFSLISFRLTFVFFALSCFAAPRMFVVAAARASSAGATNSIYL